MNCYLNIRNFWPLIGVCSFPFAQTEVNFETTSETVSEISGSYQIPLSVVGEDAVYPTTVQVRLASDDEEDINNCHTQTVSFPANDGSNQNLIITISNDAIVEVNQSLRF